MWQKGKNQRKIGREIEKKKVSKSKQHERKKQPLTTGNKHKKTMTRRKIQTPKKSVKRPPPK